MIQTLKNIEQHLANIQANQQNVKSDWLTIPEAANELRVSADTIQRLVACGKLKAAEIETPRGKGFKRRHRIYRDWIKEFMFSKVKSVVPEAKPSVLPRHRLKAKIEFIKYWQLRDYFIEGQLGNEESPFEYLDKLVAIFHEVQRVLKDDGTFWLVMGDTYSTPKVGNTQTNVNSARNREVLHRQSTIQKKLPKGFRPYNLMGIPWRLAFALQDDGWNLITDIVWHKSNGMPDGVKRRPSRNHEYVFMFTKTLNYYYDHQAMLEKRLQLVQEDDDNEFNDDRAYITEEIQNKRSVWTVAVGDNRSNHRVVFPKKLIRPCILAGCPRDGWVLDPFNGSATTGVVALKNDRNYLGIELNPDYVKDNLDRLGAIPSLFIQHKCPDGFMGAEVCVP